MKLKSSIAFLTYLGLAVIMTWPLSANLTTHIMGGGGDAPLFLWNAWWVQQALFSKESLFITDYIFFPQTVSLAFHTLALVNSFVIALFSLVMNIILAFNLYFLISIALSGFSMFLLVRYITRSSWSAFISGIVFAFAPYITIHWLGHQNLVTLWFLPLFVLFLIRTVKENKWRWPLLAGAVAGLASLNDFYNFIFIFIFSLLFIFWLVIAQRKQINWWLIGKRILAGGLVWLALWSIWVIPAIQAVLQGQYGPIMTIEQISAYYSADPLRYFTPSFLNPILGRLASMIPGRFSGGVEGTIFLGYTSLIIVIVFLIHRFRNKFKDTFFPSIWFWIITIISFGLLSFGPYLKVAERITTIPLPYLWLYEIFQHWGNFRVPARFSLMVIFAMAILVGYALSQLLPRLQNLWTQKFLILFVSLLIIIEFMPAPYPIMDLSLPPVYEFIKKDKESISLIDIPWGINSGYWDKGHFQSRFVYYATQHHKKMAIGSISRVPYSYFEFYPEDQPPFIVPEDQIDLSTLAQYDFPNLWSTDLAVIHKNYLSNNDIIQYVNYFERIGFIKVFEDETEIAYKQI